MLNSLPAIHFFDTKTTASKPLVAISSCLMGEAVRYDGKHQLLASKNLLASALTLLPLCPEVGAGMTVPRPAIQLVNQNEQISALGRNDKALNVTVALDDFRRHSLQGHSHLLCGYIFKSRSPSCGLNSTPIYTIQGEHIATGSGMQADYVQQQWPWLALIEEQYLLDEQACQRFILLCKLLFDLRRGCETKGLKSVHRHYASQMTQLSIMTQQQLAALSTGPVTDYWQFFIAAVAKLTENQSSKKEEPPAQ